MYIHAAPGATPIVERFILNLNTLLNSTPQVEPARAGVKRAAAREKAQTKAMKEWWASAAKARKKNGDPYSRQVIRRMARDAAKSKRSAAKRSAMRAYALGGAAEIS